MRPVLLVVEDEPLLRRAIGRAAAAVGFEVVQVADAGGALTALRSRAFDAVMSDLELGPGPDGTEVLEFARKNAPRCLRVLCSGAVPAALEGAARAGLAHLVWEKPVGLAALRELFARVRPDSR